MSFAFPFVKVVVKTTKGLTLAETPINTDGSACWKLESRTGSVIGRWPRELQQVSVRVRGRGLSVGAETLLSEGLCLSLGLSRQRQLFSSVGEGGQGSRTEGRGGRAWVQGGFCTPRLGALEVQLAVWERGDPLPKVHLVHSKLQTLQWPNTDNVMRKVAMLLPCSQLAVTVKVMDYHDGVGLEVAAPDKLVRAAPSCKYREARSECVCVLRESVCVRGWRGGMGLTDRR